jgi:hypothetical protein
MCSQRRHLSRIGGSDRQQMIRSVMKEVITYRMASQYSMYGFKTKKGFADLPVCKTIIREYRLIQIYNLFQDFTSLPLRFFWKFAFYWVI